MITHLEPGILECEVKWTLQSWWRWWNFSWAVSNPKRWCGESAELYMPANVENSAVATGLEKVSFHSNPKERQCQEGSNYCTIALISVQFISVQLLSRVRLFATPWIVARQASLSVTNSRSSLKLTSIELVMPSSHLILCRPSFPPAPNPS